MFLLKTKNNFIKYNLYYFKSKLHKILLRIRYEIILKIIGNMPVIVNCVIYDDIIDRNFGLSVTKRPCICFNNRVLRIENVIRRSYFDNKCYTGGDATVIKQGFAFTLGVTGVERDEEVEL